MRKIKNNRRIDKDLIKKHNLLLSVVIDIKLQEYSVLFKGKTNNHNAYSKDNSGAYGLVVMTSPSHGGGLRFKSG